MLRLETHCHTIYSKDSLVRPEKLLKACERKGIHRVVISDHNTTKGAFAAQMLDPERVIIGEEILTTRGELLAAYMKEEIPAGLTPLETIERLQDQGAFISISHPFDVLRRGHWQEEDLLEIAPLVDAIEVFNARCISPDFNRQASEFAEKHNLHGTVGSDAHGAYELGRAAMLLPDFDDAESLKEVLPQAKFETRLSSPFVRFTSRYAVLYKEIFNLQLP
jgi:predicted metal-dependent phosphoesterase TrpH